MAITVGVDAYIDVSGADSYFANRLYADAWLNAFATDKEKALKQATKAIDRQPLKGRPVDPAQPLAFPHCYPTLLNDVDRYYLQGWSSWWCESEVPQAVKDACCEEALALLERGNSQRRKLQQEGVQSASIGNLSETYTPGAGRGLLSQEARELLKPYLAGAVSIT
ncbi:MAG: hypothetical protein M0T85_00735 [Dehalococcoidales bacterium]|nr:hypothetical protein [Dehalococcoidales bacterium]